MLFTLETGGLVIGNRMQRCLVEVETKMLNVLKIKKLSLWLRRVMKNRWNLQQQAQSARLELAIFNR